ncbi:MAG: DUF1934 family protein [Bacilli bacterium]|nr:DUF1934 family protein [Bacilli bacterium]
MKVIVEFKKNIIENGIKNVELNFTTNGMYINRTLTFVDNEKQINTVTINFAEVIIERKSTTTSKLILKNKNKTNYDLNTPYGKMSLDIYTNELIINKDSIYVIYQIVDDVETSKLHELQITFKELNK